MLVERGVSDSARLNPPVRVTVRPIEANVTVRQHVRKAHVGQDRLDALLAHAPCQDRRAVKAGDLFAVMRRREKVRVGRGRDYG